MGENNILDNIQRNSILIDMSTISPNTSIELSKNLKRVIHTY